MTSSRAPTLFALRKATRTGTSTLVLARPGVVGELGMCGRSHDVAADREDRIRLSPAANNPSSVAADALCRHTPKVGAACGNSARAVLCGGRSVTTVPTANRVEPKAFPAVSAMRRSLPKWRAAEPDEKGQQRSHALQPPARAFSCFRLRGGPEHSAVVALHAGGDRPRGLKTTATRSLADLTARGEREAAGYGTTRGSCVYQVKKPQCVGSPKTWPLCRWRTVA